MTVTERSTRALDANAGVNDTGVRIRAVRSQADWRDAQAIITEHLDWIAASLAIDHYGVVQPGLDEELTDLRRFYSPPQGRLFLARLDGVAAGTAGVVVWPDGSAELKRVYVRPAARGHGIGEMLVRRTLRAAAELGCHTMQLASLPGLMDTAIAIYRRLGFREAAPFGDLDLDDAIYLARPLSQVAG